VTIIRHHNQLATQGYYSKIINRKIVSLENGSQTCTVWDQIIPPSGYITDHYHEVEETLTILTGCLQITMGGESYEVTADTTIFIPPLAIHSAINIGNDPVRLIALLMSAEPRVIYPNGYPAPVIWDK
jgi:mannose-6-phosphate isomerase-like protein (cupin superfamily)